MRVIVLLIAIVLAGCIHAPEARNARAELSRDLDCMNAGAPPPQDLGVWCAQLLDDPHLDKRHILENRYDFLAWVEQRHALPHHAIIITMSGGGTRAATLAQSVLVELDRYRMADGTTLADNVILVSAVSGGTMTATAFALRGKSGVASVQFETGILGNRLEAVVVRQLENPFDWSDRARGFEQNLEDSYFGQAKFRDLVTGPNAAHAPFLILNATDIVTGRGFPFTEQRMADLCTDLFNVKLSSAMTAAGNFPFASTDIELQNFNVGSACAKHDPSSGLLDNQPNTYEDLTSVIEWRYRTAMAGALHPDSLEQQQIAWLHLYDGGLADNLGIRAVLRLLNHQTLAALTDRGVIDIAFIQINARSDPDDALNLNNGSPNFVLDLLMKSSYGPIDRVTAIDQLLANEHLGLIYEHWNTAQYPGHPPSPFYPIVVDFDRLTDRAERWRLKQITTQQALTPDKIADIREAGIKLLEANPCFQEFARNIAFADRPVPGSVTGKCVEMVAGKPYVLDATPPGILGP
jgi:NTE family protein